MEFRKEFVGRLSAETPTGRRFGACSGLAAGGRSFSLLTLSFSGAMQPQTRRRSESFAGARNLSIFFLSYLPHAT